MTQKIFTMVLTILTYYDRNVGMRIVHGSISVKMKIGTWNMMIFIFK